MKLLLIKKKNKDNRISGEQGQNSWNRIEHRKFENLIAFESSHVDE